MKLVVPIVFTMATLLAAPMRTQAQPATNEQLAKAAFEEASALARKELWAEACPRFEQAHGLFPTGGTAINLANCNEKIGKKKEALTLYRFVLDLSASQSPERLMTARARVDALEAELEASQPPPALPPATPPAAAPKEVPAAPAAPKEEPTSSGPGYIPAIASFAIGGAGLIVGAVTGGLALSQMNSVRDTCDGTSCPLDQQDAFDEARTMAWASNVGFIAGGVGVGVGIVLVIVQVVTDGSPTDAAVTASRQGLLVRF